MIRERLMVSACMLFMLLAAQPAFADGVGALRSGLDEAAGPEGAQLSKEGTLPGFAGTVIASLLSVMAILFFLLSVYGGFLWMTARGNEERVTRGKNTIIAAVIGMIIVIGSYAVTRLVLGSTAGQ